MVLIEANLTGKADGSAHSSGSSLRQLDSGGIDLLVAELDESLLFGVAETIGPSFSLNQNASLEVVRLGDTHGTDKGIALGLESERIHFT